LSTPESPLSAEDLIYACANAGTAGHWQEFVRCFNDDIISAVYRAARHWGNVTPELLQELVQDTYLKLCDPQLRVLSRFQSRGSGTGAAFIKVVATNLVIDHFKSLYTVKHGGGLRPVPEEEQVLLASSDQSAGSSLMLEREVLLAEIDKSLLVVAQGPTLKRDRRIFWYYYRHGMSAREIADLPSTGLGVKGVESVILRLTRLIREYLTAQHLLQLQKKRDDISGSGIRIAESL
jgi:RNA polymerase sigma-70 factor (ECF subfamily)